MNEKLKSCPFCGGEAAIYSGVTSYHPPVPKAYVYCKECYVATMTFEDMKNDGAHFQKAIEAWNRRANENDTHDQTWRTIRL